MSARAARAQAQGLCAWQAGWASQMQAYPSSSADELRSLSPPVAE